MNQADSQGRQTAAIRTPWGAASYRRAMAGPALAILAMASTPAFAQTAPAAAPEGVSVLDEVIVTAQRRTERLQDVGIAVSAYTAEKLQDLGLSKSSDIAQLTPGVYVSGSYGGQTLQFTVRGVTQSSFSDSLETPVAVYVDQVYIPAQQGQSLAMFDIAQIEVLKGPQGTLFGRNATGGLVHTLVAQPVIGETTGFLRQSVGSYSELKTESALNLPIGSTAAVRGSIYYNKIGDYWKNDAPDGLAAGSPFFPTNSDCCKDLGGGRTYGGRLQLKFEPNEDLSVRVSASGVSQKYGSAPYTGVATVGIYDARNQFVGSIYASPTETRFAIGPDGQNLPTVGMPYRLASYPGNGTRVPGADWFGYVPVSADDRHISTDVALDGRNTASVWMLAGYLDYDLGWATLSTISAYQEHEKSFLLDGDGGPENYLAVAADAKSHAFSQEARLSGGEGDFRWTAGAYYLENLVDTAGGLLGPRGSIFATLYGRPAGIQVNGFTKTETKSLSGFGQFELDFAENWRLILGGRVIRERLDVSSTGQAAYASVEDYEITNATRLFPTAPGYANRVDDTLWAGKAQIEYRPSQDLLFYAGVNRGVKGGGVNGQSFTLPLTPDQLVYGPETLLNYEVGQKYTNGQLTVNSAVYYYDYNDFQAFLFTNAAGFTQNLPSTIYGVDLDVGFRFNESLTATVGASYSHATVDDFVIAPGVAPRTVRPPYAPRTQATAALYYTAPQEIAGGEVSVNAVVSYASGIYNNLRNFEGNWFKERTLVNLSANWTGTDTWKLSAFVTNVFDERYGQIGFDNTQICGCQLVSYGQPRTFGVTAGYSF